MDGGAVMTLDQEGAHAMARQQRGSRQSDQAAADDQDRSLLRHVSTP
jgi:hypothetical protein